jgi:MATE family multidrug resistance protein
MNSLEKPNYQLTEHPVGSMREIWGVSWPLMLTIFSSGLMFFAERIYLAHHSVSAMNAMAIGGMWSWFFLVFPMCICEITEVFVGKHNGKGERSLTSRPVYQMLWMILCIWPIYMALSRIVSTYYFGSDSEEAKFLVTFMDFAPFQLVSTALAAFFIGQGKMKVITLSTISANLLNLALAPFFIFVCDYGVTGAALAAGLSLFYQAAMMAFFYLKKENRINCNTGRFEIDLVLTKKMLAIGVPSGLGRAVEVLSHCLYFALVAQVSVEALTTVTFVQSFYLLTMFSIDALNKGTTAVVSNLLGARMDSLVPKTIRSAFSVHTVLALIVMSITYLSCEPILALTLTGQDTALLSNEVFIDSVKRAMLWMGLFFLMDGFAWISAGYLTAKGDTKFLMYVSICANWFTYLLPVYLLATYFNPTGDQFWMIIALNCALMAFLYGKRAQKQLNEHPYDLKEASPS